MNQALWTPSPAFTYNSNLTRYTEWLSSWNYGEFDDYESLWQWSVDEPEKFWASLWVYFDVQAEYREILPSRRMPGTEWFTGSSINYAEYIFRNADPSRAAIIHKTEITDLQEMNFGQLEVEVARVRAFLVSKGVGKDDVVAAFVSNVPEATILWLATISIGAIWTSCSPDFGVNSVVERFKQVEPKVFLAVNGYTYNTKPYSRVEEVTQIREQLDTLVACIELSFLKDGPSLSDQADWINWDDLPETKESLSFEMIGFNHPMCILYSSGTTGKPKAITHSHGGLLLEHLKYLTFHNDVHADERFFWFSTTGWMMWNFVNASLLCGAAAVLYDGSPSYPSLDAMWEFIEEAKINHFGTSAPFIVACMKRSVEPAKVADLSTLRSIGSTGSPLPPEAFEYVYSDIKSDVWLASMSGGTDVCTAFVGGCPWKPVYSGKLQCRALGVDLHAYNESAEKVVNEVGEMVILTPLPSMPIFFWNDKNMERYRSAYYDVFPDVWRHGDWIEIHTDGQLIIHGRSDATLNRQGVRIGTGEIYRAIDQIEAITDSLIINLELSEGRHFMPLFVIMADGQSLTDQTKKLINTTLKTTYSPRHVPDYIIAVPDIPYTISGKKMEAPVKRILLQHPIAKAINKDAMRNPECVDWYVNYAETIDR